MKTVGWYIKGDFLSQLSKKETIIFFQVLRITNSLEFWARMHLMIKGEQNKVFEERNQMELCFAMISFYKESTKEFDRNLAEGLLNMNLSKTLSLKISEYKAWLENWKQDEYLQVVHRIRNKLRFHLESSIYDKYIKEGNKSKDLMIGISIGEQFKDFLYKEPYSFEFQYIAESVPATVRKDKINWIQKKTAEETSKFIILLRKIIGEIIKGNAYKRIIDT